jgi:hypothetical protein
MYDQSPQGASQSDKIKVTESLDTVSLDWVDQDQERPPVDFWEDFRASSSPAWSSCYSYIDPILTNWLTDHTPGPICDVIKLRQGKLVLFQQRQRYCVKMEIYENFTTDPCIADCYPARITARSTIEQANQAARESLGDELGQKEDARIWHEVYHDDGRVRIRAVYQDEANNAKAIAWVEEELVDEPTDHGEDEEDDNDDDKIML